MIYKQLTNALKELQEITNLGKNEILVVGCSTSEVIGKKNRQRL